MIKGYAIAMAMILGWLLGEVHQIRADIHEIVNTVDAPIVGRDFYPPKP